MILRLAHFLAAAFFLVVAANDVEAHAFLVKSDPPVRLGCGR